MGLTRPRLGQFQTTTAAFDDPLVVFNNNASGSNTKDIGIVFERGDDQNKVLIWDESADQFVLANSTEQGSTGGDVTLASYAGLQVGVLKSSSFVLNGALTFPTADGTAGQFLKTDGSGTLSFGTVTSSLTLSDGSNTDTFSTGETLTFTGGTGLDSTISDNTVTFAIDSTVATLTGTQTLTNKTLTSPNITGLSLGGTAVTSTAAELNILDGVTATTSEINTLDGITATTTELNYVDGVTSAIQTQLDAKLPLAGGTMTGDIILPADGTIGAASDASFIKFNETSTAYSGLDLSIGSNQSVHVLLDMNADGSTTGGFTVRTGATSVDSSTEILKVNSDGLTLDAQNQLRFADSDSSNYVGFKSPATVTANIMWTLPSSDGTDGQVLSTNGGGTLSFVDQGGGGGSGSSYPNSTYTTAPGSDGDFDLSYNVAQDTQETPFEVGGADSFGVNLGSVFSLMDPIGSTETVDLGAFT